MNCMQIILEDLAQQTLTDLAITCPVDSSALALGLGLHVVAAPIATSILSTTRRTIYVNSAASIVRQHGLIAHECAHHLLISHGLPNEERWANYLGAALLAPCLPLMRDITATDANLMEISRRHPHASLSLLATRVVELCGGTVSLWDNGVLRWVRGRMRIPSWDVSAMAVACGRLSCPVFAGETTVWPVGDGFAVAIEKSYRSVSRIA